MRVLHVIRNLNDGGMERIVADLVATLARADGVELHVLSLRPGGRFAGLLDGLAQLHTAPPDSGLSMLRPTSMARSIARIEPNIVHTHSGTWFKAARAARMAGVRKVVFTEHGRHHPDPFFFRVVDGLAARMTDAVVAVSSALGEYMIRELHVPARKVRVILNGIDLAAVRSRSARTDLSVRGDPPFTFVSVGRLEPVKGLDQLVDVMAEWPTSAPPCRILVAGEGSERSRLERRIGEAGLEESFELLGWVDEPVGLFKAADAYLLPSHSEGTSISLLEAMASGCPPVATDVGGNADILGSELSRWLVPAGDVAGLRDRMVRLASSPGLVEDVADRARSRVEAGFTLEEMANAYLRTYRNLLEGRPGR